MHSVGGVLEQMPVVGVHLPGIRTKVSKRLAATVTKASQEVTFTPLRQKKQQKVTKQ